MSLLANLFNSYEIESKHLENLKVLKENIVNETDLEKKIENYNLLFNYIEHIENRSKLNNYIIKNSKKDRYGYSTDLGFFVNKDIVKKLYDDYKKGYKKTVLIYNSLIQFENELDSIPKHEIVINKSSDDFKRSLEKMKNVIFSKIGKSFDKSRLFKFVVIDVETTGLSANRNKIVEISAIKFIDFEPVESFSTLVNPRVSISEEVTLINSINNDMVKNSPLIFEVIEDFDDFVNGFDIVGYNTIFDLKFLYVNGSKILEQKGIKIYDVCELAAKVLEKDDKRDLNSVCEKYNIYRKNSHRSLSDCYATKLVFEKIIDDIIEK